MTSEQERPTQLLATPTIEQHLVALSYKDSEQYDPLDANRFYHSLPSWLSAGESNTVREAAIELGSRASQLDYYAMDPQQVRIYHRDYGLMVTAAVLSARGDREILEANDVVPGSGALLYQMSEVDGLPMRPDDALFTSPPNTRRFTNMMGAIMLPDANGTPQAQLVYFEDLFKLPIYEALSHQNEFVDQIVAGTQSEIPSSEFIFAMQQAKKEFSPMVGAMLFAKEHVPDEWFSQNLLCWLDSYTINGKPQTHTGAHSALNLIADYALWGAGSDDQQYLDHLATNIDYASRKHKQQFNAVAEVVSEKGSIASQVETAMQNNPDAQTVACSIAANDVLSEMIRFRGPHHAKMEASLAHRPDHHTSGGNQAITKNLLDETHRQKKRLKQHLRQSPQRSE